MSESSSNSKFRKWQKNKILKEERRKRNRNKYDPNKIPQSRTTSKLIFDENYVKICAPEDFRLLENTEKCLEFFRDIRDTENAYFIRNRMVVHFTLKYVEQIDYSTISALNAIMDEFKFLGIQAKGDFPINTRCKEFFVQSGILNKMYDRKGRPFPNKAKSNIFVFEQGAGKFSENDNRVISEMIKDVVEHLTGTRTQNEAVKTILLEICGNSIEWSGTKNKQWSLGVNFQDDRVVFTVTDIGKGIYKTLDFKYRNKLRHLFQKMDNKDILYRAFEKKYESSSGKENRNLGLPEIRNKFLSKNIEELKVLTNNVILHFDDIEKSRVLKKGTPWFKGTFYRWILTKESIQSSFKKAI